MSSDLRSVRRRCRGYFLVALAICGAPVVVAESGLQQVSIGGEVRIRGHVWENVFNDALPSGAVPPVLRWPGSQLPGRAIGDVVGGPCVYSYRDWDDAGSNLSSVAQRTAIHVQADFTQEVTTFIELDAYRVFGQDFRSNYVTGVDGLNLGDGDVDVYQAYVEARDLWGLPLQLRVGRQELNIGGGWLLGNGDALSEFTMLSFDAIRLTYTQDRFSLDAFWSKLGENSGIEQDGDVDFSGVYARYAFSPAFNLDAYWFLLRDGRAGTLGDCGCTDEVRPADAAVLLLSDVDYDPTYLNTVGVRGAGEQGAWDYEVELAYQFGPADQLGSLFRRRLVGDDEARFDAFAAHAEVGYTIDSRWSTRVYLRGAYFEGEDHRAVSFRDWQNPFSQPTASISFNRLFSNNPYSEILDHMGQMSNFWTVQAGVELSLTEKVSTQLSVAHFETVEAFDQPLHVRLNGQRLAPFPGLPFLTDESSSDMGWEAALKVAYRYSDDLEFSVGWSHLFTGDGLYEGNYSDLNGLLFNGGTGRDDADYFYAQALIRF